MTFDVYRQMGGTERMRIATMWLTHLTFVLETSIWTAMSRAGSDGPTSSLRVLRSAAGLRHSRFVRPRAVRQLLSALRAS